MPINKWLLPYLSLDKADICDSTDVLLRRPLTNSDPRRIAGAVCALAFSWSRPENYRQPYHQRPVLKSAGSARSDRKHLRRGPPPRPLLQYSTRYTRAATSWNISALSEAEYCVVSRLNALYITVYEYDTLSTGKLLSNKQRLGPNWSMQ